MITIRGTAPLIVSLLTWILSFGVLRVSIYFKGDLLALIAFLLALTAIVSSIHLQGSKITSNLRMLMLLTQLPTLVYTAMFIFSMFVDKLDRIDHVSSAVIFIVTLFLVMGGGGLLLSPSKSPTSALMFASAFFLVKFLEGNFTDSATQVSDTDWALPVMAGTSVLVAIIVSQICEQKYSFALNNKVSHYVRLLLIPLVSSYFWSGFAKVAFLWESGAYWPLENSTHYLVKNALVSGTSVIGLLDESWQDAFVGIVSNPTVSFTLNSAALGIQLLSILLIFIRPKSRLGYLLIVLIELEHLSIFFFTGIFFWKWMLILVAVTLPREHLRNDKKDSSEPARKQHRWSTGWLPIAFILAPTLQLPILAWFDSPLLVRIELSESAKEAHSGVEKPGIFVSKHNLVPYELPSLQSRELSGQYSGAFGGADLTVAKEARKICEDGALRSLVQKTNPILLNDSVNEIWEYGERHDLSNTSLGETIFPHHIFQMHEPSERFVSQAVYVPISSSLSTDYQLWIVYTCVT